MRNDIFRVFALLAAVLIVLFYSSLNAVFVPFLAQAKVLLAAFLKSPFAFPVIIILINLSVLISIITVIRFFEIMADRKGSEESKYSDEAYESDIAGGRNSLGSNLPPSGGRDRIRSIYSRKDKPPS